MCNRSPLQPQICALLHSFRHIGTKGDLIGNIAHTTCGQNYINLLNHGINQDPKIYVSICWSNIRRPLLHLFHRPRLLSSSLINVSPDLAASSIFSWRHFRIASLSFVRFAFQICILHASIFTLFVFCIFTNKSIKIDSWKQPLGIF